MATDRQLAELSDWLDHYTARVAEFDQQVTEATWAPYSQVRDWEDPRQTVPAARDAMDAAETARAMNAGLAAEFAGFSVALATGTTPRLQSVAALSYPRNADPFEVYSRPVHVARTVLAQGGTEVTAIDTARRRLTQIARTDARMTRRNASVTSISSVTKKYRRVIRPELSKTGTCGLCIAASTQIYSTKRLMPIHSECNCEVMAIVGSVDPGDFNQSDLERIYAEMPTTDRQELATFRYQVTEHHELGPLLHPDAKQRTVPRAEPQSAAA